MLETTDGDSNGLLGPHQARAAVPSASASVSLKGKETLIFGVWWLLQLHQPDLCADLHMFTHKCCELRFLHQTAPLTLAAKVELSGAVPRVCLAHVLDGRCVIRPALKASGVLIDTW